MHGLLQNTVKLFDPTLKNAEKHRSKNRGRKGQKANVEAKRLYSI